MSEVAAPELVQVQVSWANVATAQALHVNQALGQVGPPASDGLPDGVYITMGIVPPPPLIDSAPQDQAEMLERIKAEGLKVNILGQFHLSRQVLADLIGVLQSTAAKYDAAVEQHKKAAGAGGQQG